MKPSKNHYFCYDCMKPKMLFPSEKKAMRCIEMNADEIFEETGKRPIRCYYCMACGGWHITSKKANPRSKSKVELYFMHKDNILKSFGKINQSCNSTKTLAEVIKTKVNQLKKEINRKRINDSACKSLIINLIDAFTEISNARMMTGDIDTCYISFKTLYNKYFSKVNRGLIIQSRPIAY